MKTLARCIRLACGIAVFGTMACAHAPPVTGNHARDAPPDPDNPEQNCSVNNTIDCRPAPAG